MGVPKTSDHIKINIRMQNPSQDPPSSSKSPNEDLKDVDVFCTFKIKVEGRNSDYGCTKDQWPYPHQYQDAKPQSGTSSILQSHKSVQKGRGCSLHLKNQDRKPKFEILVYHTTSKAPHQDLKEMCVLCSFKIKIYIQNSGDGYIKDKWPYPNQSLHAKPHQEPPLLSSSEQN